MLEVKPNVHVSPEECNYLRTTPGYGVLRELIINKHKTAGEEKEEEIPKKEEEIPKKEHEKPSSPKIISESEKEETKKNEILEEEPIKTKVISPPALPERDREDSDEETVSSGTERAQYELLLTEEQKSISRQLRSFFLDKTVKVLCSEKVVALSSELPLSEVMNLMIENKISAAPVFDDKMNTIGLIDGNSLMMYVLTYPRPSYMDEFLEENSASPFYQTVGKLMSLRKPLDPFSSVNVDSNLLELAKIFTTPRKDTTGNTFAHNSCVLTDGEITHMVNQMKIIAFISKHYEDIFGKINPKILALRAIVPKVWCVFEDAKAGSAFASIIHHKISSVAVLNSSNELVNELSAETIHGGSIKAMEEHLHDTVQGFINVRKGELQKPVTCSPDIKLRELLELFVSKNVKRVWVLSSKHGLPFLAKKLIGVITLTSLLRALLGDAPNFADQEDVVKKRELKRASDNLPAATKGFKF